MDLMTDVDVATRPGVGERWIAEAAKKGLIPHIRFGRTRRYREEHIAEIIAAHEVRPRFEPARFPPSGRIR